ncbi:MAG: hypothetical protein MZU95_02060 [Desulfomicrobium escambiense]|nr:hypothetical protein [Desulfomicrobium escambiense]
MSLPGTEVSLWTKGQDVPVKLLVGMENPLDKTPFRQARGRPAPGPAGLDAQVGARQEGVRFPPEGRFQVHGRRRPG